MSITRKIAEFICQTEFEHLPPESLAKAKLAFLDWLGVSLAGSRDPASLIIHKTLMDFGGEPQAILIGHNQRTDILSAALLNGCFGHALDFDDSHIEMIGHPSAPIFPAVLALAEWKKISAPDFITAYILGVELACRLARAINPEHYLHGWHATATCGVFGSAAASAKLLKLDSSAMVNTLGAKRVGCADETWQMRL